MKPGLEPSIFTKIINGLLPSYKIYEDEETFAFLDIHPAQPGHILVVPKNQVDRFEDLGDADIISLMATVRRLMHRVVEVMGDEYRPCLKVEGFAIPHAHVHIIPCRTPEDFWVRPDPEGEVDHKALAAMAKRLALE